MKPALAVLMALVTLTACGGPSAQETQRAAVDGYVREAQSVLARDRAGLEAANAAYVAYARGELTPGDTVAKMRAAERVIVDARDGIAVLDPAEPARTLHHRLLTYLDRSRDLARETTKLAVYTPAAERALTPIARLNRRLAVRIERSDAPATQIRALRDFSDGVARVERGLRRLRPPPVLVPAHRDQIRRLEETGRLATRLRKALADRDARAVAVLLKRFRAANGSGEGLAALERQARVRYAQRIAQLRDTYAAVQRETAAIQRRFRAAE
jgi:hypothetical protein